MVWVLLSNGARNRRWMCVFGSLSTVHTYPSAYVAIGVEYDIAAEAVVPVVTSCIENVMYLEFHSGWSKLEAMSVYQLAVLWISAIEKVVVSQSLSETPGVQTAFTLTS